ncbi:MAG TPA: hypothetical protein VFR67_31530, partial [Pilimelia sp.]|nr:hypothetical protein [Pilimelia sp.]
PSSRAAHGLPPSGSPLAPRRSPPSAHGSTAGSGGGPPERPAALLAAVTLDGVPENLALGMLGGAEGGGLVLLVAIFLSNFPESLVGAASMRQQGHSARYVLGTWSAAAVLLALAVVLGAWLFGGSSGTEVSLPLAFAAGAVVASLADTLMPQAYEKGGPAVALATAAGFLISYLLTAL